MLGNSIYLGCTSVSLSRLDKVAEIRTSRCRGGGPGDQLLTAVSSRLYTSTCSPFNYRGHGCPARHSESIRHQTIQGHLFEKAFRPHSLVRVPSTMPTLSGSSAVTGVTRSQLAEVVRFIRKCPIIDNHAHPLLKPEALTKYPLLSITTEASGDAIHAAFTSLSHIRGVKQLAHVLECGQTWEAVVGAIEQRRIDDYEDWVSECLDGVASILLDDGLDAPDDAEDYAWHTSFTRSPCKRIVRIETVAGRIVHEHAIQYKDGDDLETLMVSVFAEFDDAIREAIADPEVVGFKSVICYRTGLDVSAKVDSALAQASFNELVSRYDGSAGTARLQHPGLNDFVLHRAAVLISQMPERRKPIQFHTGLGDNDITLAKSSPAHLQEFIRTYPTVPIVLLHAGYPFTRELGYLATVYSNVYAVSESSCNPSRRPTYLTPYRSVGHSLVRFGLDSGFLVVRPADGKHWAGRW